jgi:hypothetical protein
MDRSQVLQYIQQLKQEYDVRVYTPFKYFQGLSTKRQIKSRFLQIVHGSISSSKLPSSYVPFQTDIVSRTKQYKQTRPSKYTKRFEEMYGSNLTSLKKKSHASGVPIDILRKVFNKGRAAWRTGHRVGANESQWGYARVHSFLVLGCTVFSSDFTLFEEALTRMKPSDRKRWLSMKVECPKSTLATVYYRKRDNYRKFMTLRRMYITK